MANRETCHVADSACLAPAGYGVAGVGCAENTTTYVKAHCVLCGNPVCRNCSSIRVCEAGTSGYFQRNRGNKGRVCNCCQIQYLDCGDDSRVMSRMRRLVEK